MKKTTQLAQIKYDFVEVICDGQEERFCRNYVSEALRQKIIELYCAFSVSSTVLKTWTRQFSVKKEGTLFIILSNGESAEDYFQHSLNKGDIVTITSDLVTLSHKVPLWKTLLAFFQEE